MYILNLNTLIYLHELGDLAKSNLEIHFPAILSRIPLAEANLVIHIPAILSRMPLVEANLVIHILTILSWMSLAETNLVNHYTLFTLNTTFIVTTFTRRILNCKGANRRKPCTCFACLTTSPNRRSNPGCSSWIIRKFLVMIPSSRYYRESIFIHYSYVTFYVCSFPHINIHTYITYIFRVSISICKCSYNSSLLYPSI